MAELRIDWADGRAEVRSVTYSGSTMTVGDSREPLTDEIPVGPMVRVGRGQPYPWLRVRVHGRELPSMVLLTQKRSRSKLLLLGSG